MKHLAESRISVDPNVCSGKACIKGTRIRVADILLALAEGLDETEILRNFRTIHREDIHAALAYAYCLADDIPLSISMGSGKQIVVENDLAKIEELQKIAQDKFTEVLETEASKQEEITEKKVQEIKEKKAQKAEPKQNAPPKKEYDLEIRLNPQESIQIFRTKDPTKQELDMSIDNYVFEFRKDEAHWKISSSNPDIKIDKLTRRNIKLYYKNKCSVFEGYLTDDRLHKIFIFRDTTLETTHGEIV